MKPVLDLSRRLRASLNCWRADWRAALDDRCTCVSPVPLPGFVVLPPCELHSNVQHSVADLPELPNPHVNRLSTEVLLDEYGTERDV